MTLLTPCFLKPISSCERIFHCIHRYYDITEAQQAFDDLSSGNVNLRGVIAMNELASLATQAKM